MITIDKIDGKPDRGAPIGPSPEFAGVFNLMAHPTAAFAAASAIGMGLASQAMGLWLGAVTGAMQATLGASARQAEWPDAEPRPAVDAGAGIAEARARIREALDRNVGGPNVVVAMRKTARMRAPKVAEVAPAMARPAVAERPARPDDLKAIGGVGPKLEQVLNGLGVWTYAQIAAWTQAEIAWVDGELGFAGRIGRDDWVGQAARLAKAG
jgi:NADH-quinone oxidoreductase subunit E